MDVLEKTGPANSEGAVSEAGGSLNDLVSAVMNAWGWEGSYVCDVFEDFVIVKKAVYNMPEPEYYRVGYSMDEDGAVVFGEKETWERVRLDYVAGDTPPSDPPPNSEGEVSEAEPLLVETATIEAANDGTMEAVILAEGLSANGNYYGPEALQSGVAVFSGARMYADHPRRSEQRDRGQARSVRDLVGRVGTAYVTEGENVRKELRASITLSETAGWLRTLVREGLAGDVSIYANASGKKDSEGRFVVEAFKAGPHTSVDFVDVASAGGAVVRESAGVGSFWDDLTRDELAKYRPDLVEAPAPALDFSPDEDQAGGLIAASAHQQARRDDSEEALLIEGMAMDQEQIQNLQEAHDALLAENARLFGELRTQEAQRIFAEVMPQGLPDATRARIQEAAGAHIEAYAVHGDETTPEALREALAGIVEAEKAYLAAIVPNGRVQHLPQAPQGLRDDKNEKRLEEAFADILGDEKKAKIAARGRE